MSTNPTQAAPKIARITSIDALRGCVMFTMIFVNDLADALDKSRFASARVGWTKLAARRVAPRRLKLAAGRIQPSLRRHACRALRRAVLLLTVGLNRLGFKLWR